VCVISTLGLLLLRMMRVGDEDDELPEVVDDRVDFNSDNAKSR
jgi:hypothetical protein